MKRQSNKKFLLGLLVAFGMTMSATACDQVNELKDNLLDRFFPNENELEQPLPDDPENPQDPQDPQEPALTLDAPTDVAVSGSGVLTFSSTATVEVQQWLYVNGAYKAAVTSNTNIAKYLTAGENSVQLETREKNGATVSEKSAAITVTKAATPENVAVSTLGVVTFDSLTTGSVVLYVSGERIGVVASGVNITEYLTVGMNEIAFVTEIENGINSEEVAFSKTLQGEIQDLTVSEDGELVFTGYFGYSYELYVNGVSLGVYESGDEVDSADFNEGVNEIKLKVSANSENYIVLSEYSATTVVSKYQKVTDVFVAKDILTFTEEDTAVKYVLYIDGNEIGEVASGADLSSYFTKAGTVDIQVVAVATIANTVGGELSVAFEYEVPKYARFVFEPTKDGAVETTTVNSIEGVMISKNVSGTGCGAGLIASYTETVDILSMDGTKSLIKFLPKNYTGAFLTANGYVYLQVNIIDVNDPTNVITVNYGNVTANNVQTYFVVEYKGTEIHPAYSVIGGAWGSTYYTLKFNGATKTLNYGEGSYKLDGTDLPNLTGFENGAYITFSSNGWINANQEIFVSQIGGYEFKNGALVEIQPPLFDLSSNDNYVVTTHEEQEGFMINVAGNGGGRTIATFNKVVDILSMNGTLLDFKFVYFTGPDNTANGASKKRFFVNFIDVNDSSNVISVEYAGKNWQDFSDTTIEVSYKGTTKGFTTSSLMGVQWGTTFNTIAFNGATKTLTYDGVNASFDGTNLPQITGFENGAYITFSANSWINANQQIFVKQIGGYSVQNGVVVKA